MQIYEELVARGLIAQVTDENEIREMVNAGKATFYIGFDPTADSLHVGHFMALCLMKRLQMAGNRPVVLIGGGTAYIGDPSGRTDMRSMMTASTISSHLSSNSISEIISSTSPRRYFVLFFISPLLTGGNTLYHKPLGSFFRTGKKG